MDTFTKAAPVGSFASTSDTQTVYTGDHGMAWTEYPDGWPSTYTHGVEGYQPSTVQSVHDGVLDWYLHNSNGHPVSANPSPEPAGNRYQTYGVWSFCEKIAPSDSTNLADFYQAPLLWPPSDGNGPSAESDFPEGHLSAGDLSAFAHYGSGQQDAFDVKSADPSFDPYQWHVYTQEWGPGYRSYYVDGNLIGTSTHQVWSTPERWQIQVEPSGSNDGGTGHVYVNWVWIGTPGGRAPTSTASSNSTGGSGNATGGSSSNGVSSTPGPAGSSSSSGSGNPGGGSLPPWPYRPLAGGTHRSPTHLTTTHKTLVGVHKTKHHSPTRLKGTHRTLVGVQKTKHRSPTRLKGTHRTLVGVHKTKHHSPTRLKGTHKTLVGVHKTKHHSPTRLKGTHKTLVGVHKTKHQTVHKRHPTRGGSGTGKPTGTGTAKSGGSSAPTNSPSGPGPNPGGSAVSGGAPGSGGTGTIQHVVEIWMENNDYANIYGPQPYETQIANTYGLATNYYATGHFSLDNYLTATGGVIGQGNDDSCGSFSGDNVFNQLGSGQAINYVESGNTDCDHNPASQWADLGSSYTATLPSAPFSSTAFNPKFVFITPNRTDDDHDTSPSTGDAWLSNEVPAIMATPQYQAGTMAIFIVFDESNVNDTQGNTTPPNNHVYLSVISPYTHGVKDSTTFTHCSLLRTVEDVFGLSPLGCAASAPSMVGHFGF